MVEKRIRVSIDESNYFWIIAKDNMIINKDPVKEDFVGTKLVSYNRTNVCPRCREEDKITDKSILYPGNVGLDINKEGKRTGEWVCALHYKRHYERYGPSSCSNIIKSLRNRRTGNLNNSNHLLGDNCQKCTCLWLGTKDLNELYDNYISPYDHTLIPEGMSLVIGDKLVDLSEKIPQTKGKRYSPKDKGYHFSNIEREWSKEFDIMILYCIGENGDHIERIYVIPKSDIIGRVTIGIYLNNYGWSKKYRVSNQEEMKIVDKIWQGIIAKDNQ